MPRKSSKQRHLDRADIIDKYGDAFRKWRWFLGPVAAWSANSESIQLIIKAVLKALSP